MITGFATKKNIAIIVVVLGVAAFLFFAGITAYRTSVAPRNTISPAVGITKISVYNALFLSHDGRAIVVRLQPSGVVAGFTSDEATGIYRILKDNTEEKKLLSDIAPNTPIQIEVIEDSDKRSYKASRITFR